MRNYPVLKNKNKAATPINWQKTYVNSLVMHTKSLIDYSNYFLADYRRGPDFISLSPIGGFPCFSIENLRYHQFRDTEEEGYYFLKSSDYPDISLAQRIRAGRHIINNNQKESSFDTYKDWDNIVIQPMGYTAFYIMSFEQDSFYFTYTNNAQLYYGKEQPISPMAFYTRFFYKSNNAIEIVSALREQTDIAVAASNYRGTSDYFWGILDKQGFYWTDTVNNPAMGFLFKKKAVINGIDESIDPTDNSIGEEIIIDTKIKHTIEVVKNSSAVYTMSVSDKAGGQKQYPLGSVLYFL